MGFSLHGYRPRRRWVVIALAFAGVAAFATHSLAFRPGIEDQVQVPSTINDFFLPGTQPGGLDMDHPIQQSFNCTICHADYDDGNEDVIAQPWNGWVTSMMAQAARDPVWQAAVNIANQDAHNGGESCIRCHSPIAWLNGRSDPGTIDQLITDDFDSINCHFCHRMVDPFYVDGVSPDLDEGILTSLSDVPMHLGNAQYVVDPMGNRRGPYDDITFNPHGQDQTIYSPFHRESDMCGTCHDVSNPMFVKQGDTYVLDTLDAPHPDADPNNMFPEQRTYSEWAQSTFAAGGVDLEGRFGGEHATGIMESCQDCHMPDGFGGGCAFWDPEPGATFPPRDDIGQHLFNGANSWVLGAILDQYGPSETGLTEQTVNEATARNFEMLRDASDMELSVVDGQLNVRIINYSGHKLPTGYPEGRRMWINVKFFNARDKMIVERGAYNFETGELTEDDTKVYRMKLGMDETIAAMTNLPAGESFHLVLNNVILLDNRIPPIGFTNAGFDSVQAAPVNYAYADGQHWDDTQFKIPKNAASATVTVYHQTSSKEYIEFLRDADQTEGGNGPGQTVYDLWVGRGMSAPVDMDSGTIDFIDVIPGDFNGDGKVDTIDLLQLLGAWGPCLKKAKCLEDLNNDGVVDTIDLLELLGNWTS